MVIDSRSPYEATMMDSMGRDEGSEREGKDHCGPIGEREAFDGAVNDSKGRVKPSRWDDDDEEMKAH